MMVKGEVPRCNGVRTCSFRRHENLRAYNIMYEGEKYSRAIPDIMDISTTTSMIDEKTSWTTDKVDKKQGGHIAVIKFCQFCQF